MTIERFVEPIPQSSDANPVQLPLERGPGNFLLFQSSTANVTVTLFYDGVKELYANMNGGLFVNKVLPWQNMRIDGPIGTSVTFFYGANTTDTDVVDIRQQVAVIAGVTATADQPAATLVNQAPVVINTGSQGTIFPVNGTRRRIAFSIPSNSQGTTNTVFARAVGGLNNLFEVQPGVLYSDTILFGLDIRNDSGNNLTFMLYEVK